MKKTPSAACWVVMKMIFRPLNATIFLSTNTWILSIILFVQAFKDGLSKTDSNWLGNGTVYKVMNIFSLQTTEQERTEANGAGE